MGGLCIFVAVVAVNWMLLLFTSLIGVVLVDLSLIVTLLIVVYENQLNLLYGEPRSRTYRGGRSCCGRWSNPKRNLTRVICRAPRTL